MKAGPWTSTRSGGATAREAEAGKTEAQQRERGRLGDRAPRIDAGVVRVARAVAHSRSRARRQLE